MSTAPKKVLVLIKFTNLIQIYSIDTVEFSVVSGGWTWRLHQTKRMHRIVNFHLSPHLTHAWFDSNLFFHVFRTIIHHNLSFHENAKDKLRIQVYQLQTSQTNQLNLIYKKDLPLDSVVSRDKYLASRRDAELISELGEYSTSFSHGNNLNSMMGLNSMPKSRNLDTRKNQSKFWINKKKSLLFKIIYSNAKQFWTLTLTRVSTMWSYSLA